jgi:hypothetical protein
MEKYLFTDGTNGVREVQSKDELIKLIQTSTDRSMIRIWLFNTNEWITYAEFAEASAIIAPNPKKDVVTPITTTAAKEKKIPLGNWNMFSRVLIAIVAVAVIFLIYNFTRDKWEKVSPLSSFIPRPENSPPVNVDSLILVIESTRGEKLDKVTRTNLRIRNNWPDMVEMKLSAEREKNRSGSRFFNVELMIDNSTGYNIDDIQVRVTEWKDSEEIGSDTIHFKNTGYASPARRRIERVFHGDSLSASFTSLKSRSFNFCYSADKKSNYGNMNDKWFCKE